MKAEAGLGLSAVGYLGAFIRIDSSIGLASSDYLNAARAQQRPQTNTERESKVFFKLIVGQMAARVVAAVSRIEHHNIPRSRGCGSRRCLRNGRHSSQSTASQDRQYPISPAHKLSAR